MLKGDVRNQTDVFWAIEDNEAVIHLACISNDPSFDLNPRIAKSINLDCFHHFVKGVKKHKPKRVIFASSSSVYGVSEEPNVTEASLCKPITDYSKYKLQCEDMLLKTDFPDTIVTVLRPATVCGYGPRLRLDVIINALSAKALSKGEITVHGGEQIRPNLNIKDMVLAYKAVLGARPGLIDKEIFNVGDRNLSVNELAFLVQEIIPAKIVREPVKDERSYRVDSSKIKKYLSFAPTHGLSSAITSLKDAFTDGLIGDIEDSRYHNLKRIKELLSKGDI
jgi:nucleoside-diphosphate-sugar epimerase